MDNFSSSWAHESPFALPAKSVLIDELLQIHDRPQDIFPGLPLVVARSDMGEEGIRRAFRRRAREAGRDWHEGVLRLLEETQPDYLVIFPSWFPSLRKCSACLLLPRLP